MAYIGKPMKLFQKPEWAFGAAIFFGQALVKLLTAMTEEHRSMQVGNVVLFAACVLVFGLAPALMVLVFVIHSVEQTGAAAIQFQILQVALFFLGAFTYVVVGVVCYEIGEGGAGADPMRGHHPRTGHPEFDPATQNSPMIRR